MVKYDAPLSVFRAFKRAELKEMLEATAIENFTIRWKWAFRWQVIAKMGPVKHVLFLWHNFSYFSNKSSNASMKTLNTLAIG